MMPGTVIVTNEGALRAQQAVLEMLILQTKNHKCLIMLGYLLYMINPM